MPEDFQVGQGYPAPSLEELKPFIRFYVNSTKGKLDDKPTVRSTLLFAQRFVPGFYEVTGNEIPSNDSRDLYSVRACSHHNLTISDCPSGSKETELMVPLRI
jgi:hypothetical protein